MCCVQARLHDWQPRPLSSPALDHLLLQTSFREHAGHRIFLGRMHCVFSVDNRAVECSSLSAFVACVRTRVAPMLLVPRIGNCAYLAQACPLARPRFACDPVHSACRLPLEHASPGCVWTLMCCLRPIRALISLFSSDSHVFLYSSFNVILLVYCTCANNLDNKKNRRPT